MTICFFAKKVDQMAFALAICNGLYNWDMRLFVLLISISMGIFLMNRVKIHGLLHFELFNMSFSDER
ncbi:hypothetical protein C0030_002010 [Candidatus Liberibacter solanacearum]|uniref:Uncharacterized protein n=1 Tax=Candidatus Liberibacter solanacearum TaxID=556287 RepID=A0A424FMS3_9HYPH|nr:hypothetical protein C0030_002010 [Candidatus Liberibacter solanacearum]